MEELLNLRLLLAVWLGKLARFALRILGRSATTFPGRVGQFVDHKLITHLTDRIQGQKIIVTGTNGKTTTTALLGSILEAAGSKSVTNASGANLPSGIASALLAGTDILGNTDTEYLVLETDEAAMPLVTKEITPDSVTVSNLFRDQLDRFGELDRAARLIRQSLVYVNDSVCLNVDDPQVAQLAESLDGHCRPIRYGLRVPESDQRDGPEERVGVDVQFCPRCNIKFNYSFTTYGHLGHYKCPRCGFRRPETDVTGVVMDSVEGSYPHLRIEFSSEFAESAGQDTVQVHMAVPGIYNAYNALAAACTAVAMGIRAEYIQQGVESFCGAVGRMESIHLPEGELILALVKNPAGFNEVLRTSKQLYSSRVFVFAINDLAADGKDVSWLWDVQLSRLADDPDKIFICTGTRANDMAVRLKYSGVNSANIQVIDDPIQAVKDAVVLADNEPTLVLPTYTALLSLRGTISNLSQS